VGSTQKAKEKGSTCRITPVNSLTSYKSILRSVSLATKGFGNTLRHNGTVEGNEDEIVS
jgi:hypothetical protein